MFPKNPLYFYYHWNLLSEYIIFKRSWRRKGILEYSIYSPAHQSSATVRLLVNRNTDRNTVNIVRRRCLLRWDIPYLHSSTTMSAGFTR